MKLQNNSTGSTMQIIIPMSGFGERFRRAGYAVPKPLIEIDGKPIIAYVIDMFPTETNFIFICNQEHLDTPDFRMRDILQQYCPTGNIVGIAPHKLGPVHAVRKIEHLIKPLEPVVVNYCDFTCYWDWTHFKQFVKVTNCAGAIPAYKGFHPHTLGSTNYAYMRESNGWVLDIQEKQPYTNNRVEEYASSGTYYFATGQLMLDAFEKTCGQNLNVGGEFYVSLAYKQLLTNKKMVAVYELEHFMQWGTPEDVAEYQNWSATFKQLMKPNKQDRQPFGSLVIPMAGLGQRFQNEGYSLTKPLIAVSGKSMVAQATDDLPPAQKHAFVLRSDMPGHAAITEELISIYPNAVIESIPSVTDGQACTALIGLEALERNQGETSVPITFGACDNGALYDHQKFLALAVNPNIDIIVWAVRGHANAIRHPSMFGWIDTDQNGRVRNISVKTPLASPKTDPIVLGTFTFRRASDFKNSVTRLIERDGRINNEFYIDAAINDAIALGLRCHIFEVDHFLSWGTPNDLKTFEYWQSCFHKWACHSYQIEQDSHVAQKSLPKILKFMPKTPNTCV
jgi:NDP-sugar pyrophosphorylase family protein